MEAGSQGLEHIKVELPLRHRAKVLLPTIFILKFASPCPPPLQTCAEHLRLKIKAATELDLVGGQMDAWKDRSKTLFEELLKPIQKY
jgi:hypothetical protein